MGFADAFGHRNNFLILGHSCCFAEALAFQIFSQSKCTVQPGKFPFDLKIDFDILKNSENSDFQKYAVHNKIIFEILIFRLLIKDD